MEYTVIRANSLDDLIGLINSNIKNGWKPTGGVFILEGTEREDYYQALTKV